MAIFNAEPKRIPRSQNPLLVIGLGGTGTDALLNIMSKFKQRFELPVVNGKVQDTPLRTAYLAIDTDDIHLRYAQKDGIRFQPENRFLLTTTDLWGKVNNACVREWLDERINIFHEDNCARGIRQMGRLLLFECADALVNQLKNVIASLLEANGIQVSKTLDIVVTAGISGGTGSGTFLDLAYLIRYLMRTYFAGVDFNIIAYLLMPAVNIANMDPLSKSNRHLLKANGFAALKELDFWMNYDQHKLPFTQKYSDTITYTWQTPPFNDVILLDDTRENGTFIRDAYQNTMNILAESVFNFFADEVSYAGSPIGYRSHGINLNAIKGHMRLKFPTNYTYMSIGAASSDSMRDQMILYEAKLTFDRVMELSRLNTAQLPGMGTGAKPILGTNEEDRFIEAVLPPEVIMNYYSDYSVLCPLPNYFTDTAMYPPATLLTMQGLDALHGNPLHDYVISTRRTITEEIPQKMQELWNRFEETTRRYLTNAEYGPYTVKEWLTAPANGFVARFHRFVEYWQSEVNNLNYEINACTAHVEGTLYPDMLSIGPLAQYLGMWRRAESYRSGAEALYAAHRNRLVAVAIHDGFQAMENRISTYANVVLPTFCEMLTSLHSDLKSEVENLTAAHAGEGTANILNFADLKRVVDTKMAVLDGAVDETTLRILQELADASFSVQVNATGTVEGMDVVRQSFIESSQRFLANVTGAVGKLSMDQLVELRMPNDSHQDRVDYVANTLLPNLKNGALTMLNLRDRSNAHYIPYAYVSIPHDSTLIREGLNEFAMGGTRITPQYSKVVDRIYWLNTYNCLTLSNYVALPDLEKAYEYACSMSDAPGIHLVYKYNADDLKRNWSLLPSPIPHEMMAIPEDQRPVRERIRLEKLTAILSDALDSPAKAATLESNGMAELLSVRMLMNGKIVQTMDHFRNKVDAIRNDVGKTNQQKRDALKDLLEESKVFTYHIKDFTKTLADANQWSLVPADDSQAESERVAALREKARRRAAAYVLYYQHPDVAEALVKQQDMLAYFSQVYKEVQSQGPCCLECQIHFFKQRFMNLYLSDTIVISDTGLDFVRADGVTVPFVNKENLSAEEETLWGISPALVLLRIICDLSDPRLPEDDRRYLIDLAVSMRDHAAALPQEDSRRLAERARGFALKYAAAPEKIMSIALAISDMERRELSDWMADMLNVAKHIANREV